MSRKTVKQAPSRTTSQTTSQTPSRAPFPAKQRKVAAIATSDVPVTAAPVTPVILTCDNVLDELQAIVENR